MTLMGSGSGNARGHWRASDARFARPPQQRYRSSDVGIIVEDRSVFATQQLPLPIPTKQHSAITGGKSNLEKDEYMPAPPSPPILHLP